MRRAAALLALALLMAPPASAQTADTDAVPDLAQIALTADDLDGWTSGPAVRDETWDIDNAAEAPEAPSDVARYEARFTRDLADGGHQVLITRATRAGPDASDAYFHTLEHDALGQTPIPVSDLGDDAFGWRERDRASAAARIGALTLELAVSGVTEADPVDDQQIAGWLGRLIERASAAPTGPALDWTQLLPDQPPPWDFVVDQPGAGDDWQQQTGLELSAREEDGQLQAATAAREFSRTGAYRRTLTSMATVFPSAEAASAEGMNGPGAAIDPPRLGEAAAAFRMAEGGAGHEAPTVTYTIDVRRGSLVMTTQETGVAWSLDSPDEAFGLAAALDTRAGQLLGQ